jgi:hypothetical protein
VGRAYLAKRDLLDSVENKVGSQLDTLSKYDYTYDNLNRRTGVVHTGDAFDDGSEDHHWDYGYNDRSEVTAGDRREDTTLGQGNLMSPGNYDYDYDNIGNRENYARDASTTYYCVDDLNRYTGIDDDASPCQDPAESLTYDDDGNLTGDGVFS